MAYLQNPRQKRTFAPETDAGGGDLPAIPTMGIVRPQAYQGVRQLAGLSDAFHQGIAARHAPVTDQTPVSELKRRASHIAYDFSPGDGMGGGSRWANSPGGQRFFHDEPAGFLRPRTGPESAAAVGRRTELANLAGPVNVANVPVRPVLARPDGRVQVAAPTLPGRAISAAGDPASNGAAPTAAAAPAQPILQRGGAVVDGRELGYGAMVNGVPTFSDGTGGVPATMSPEQIADLGKERSITRADAGALAMPLASDALGYTPSPEQMIAAKAGQITRPITGSRPTAADFAASERNAIASGDWRSAAGTAASNLRQDAAYARTPRLRRMAEQQLANLAAGAQQSGALAQQGEQQQAAIDAQGRNALDVADRQGQYSLAEAQTQLQRPRAGNPVTLADGTLALQDTYNGSVTPSTGPDGKPARAMVTRDDSATRRTQAIQDQLARTAAEIAKNWTPPAGAQADAQPPYGQFREQAARLAGLPVVKNKTGEQLVNINGQWMPL